MALWGPTLTDNGWYPKLSPTGRYVAFGTREVYVADLPGVEVLIGPAFAVGRDVWGSGGVNQRWYPVGWLDSTTLLYVRGTFMGEVVSGGYSFWEYSTTTGLSTARLDIADRPDLTSLDARNGHWAVGLAGSPHQAWIDGVALASPGGSVLSIDGDDVIIAGYGPTGPTVWHDGLLTTVHPIHEDNTGLVRDAVFTAKLLNGRCVTWTIAAPTLVDITNVPAGVGYAVPMYCHGWFFQLLEHVGASDKTMLQYYVAGQSPLRVDRPQGSQGWVDVVYNATTRLFVVATLHDGGVTVIEWLSGGDSALLTTTYTEPPPLQQALVNPATGLATRPWATWFENQRKHTSSSPYGQIDDNSVLGRASGSFGPASALGIGTGLAVVDGLLTVTGLEPGGSVAIHAALVTGIHGITNTGPYTLAITANASLGGTNTGDQTLSGLGGVPTTRTITATAPITIAGTTSADLSANRTIAIAAASAGAAGSMSALHYSAVAALGASAFHADAYFLLAGATAADSDKLDGQHGAYYAVAGAAPTSHTLASHTTTCSAGQFFKGTGVDTFGWAAHGLSYGDVGAAAASHAHAWGDITSGVPGSFTPSAHAFIDATGHTTSGLTTGHFLKATGATTYGFAAHGLTYSDVGADVAGAAAAVTPTSLSLLIGTNTQAYSLKLTTIAALASAAGWLHNDGAGVFAYSTPTAANVGAEASGAVANHAALLTGIHGLAITAGQTLTVTTGGTLGSAAYTASGAYDVAGAAAAVTPTTLGLVIGTNTQAYSAALAAITAGTWTGASSITTLGTIATGAWNAGAITSSGSAVFTGTGGPASTFISQFHEFRVDKVPRPTTFPTLEVVAGAGLEVGLYSYQVQFIKAGLEGEGLSEGLGIQATTTAGNQQVQLSAIPVGPTGVTARKIYRTAVAPVNFSPHKLVTTISDNATTTYLDATPDASLGADRVVTDTSSNFVLHDTMNFIGRWNGTGQRRLILQPAGITSFPTLMLSPRGAPTTGYSFEFAMTDMVADMANFRRMLFVGSPSTNRHIITSDWAGTGGINYLSLGRGWDAGYVELLRLGGVADLNVLINPTVGNLGIGATTAPTARVQIADTTLAGSGSLAGSLLSSTQLWNTTGAPTAFKLTITDTASDAASMAMQILGGGAGTTNLFSVSKGGNLTVPGTTTLATSLDGLLFGTAGVVSTKAIGTDVQAYHANLAAIAAGTWTGASSLTTVGTLTTGATGAGFTVALSTSTITGTLAAARLPSVYLGTTSVDLTRASAALSLADISVTGAGTWNAGAVTTSSADRFAVIASSSDAGPSAGLSLKHNKVGGVPLISFQDNAGELGTLYYYNGFQFSSSATFAGDVSGGTVRGVSGGLVAGNGIDSVPIITLRTQTIDTGSRSWRLRNDNTAYGDFAILQETTQGGGTYAQKFTLDPTGAATFAAGVSATTGTFSGNLSANGVNIGNTREIWTSVVDDLDTLYINFRGYAGGITQFRDLIIGDGKGATVVTFGGTTKATTFAGIVSAPKFIGYTTTLDRAADFAVGRTTGSNFGIVASAIGSGATANYALYGEAYGAGGGANYSFYGAAGILYNAGAATFAAGVSATTLNTSAAVAATLTAQNPRIIFVDTNTSGETIRLQANVAGVGTIGFYNETQPNTPFYVTNTGAGVFLGGVSATTGTFSSLLSAQTNGSWSGNALRLGVAEEPSTYYLNWRAWSPTGGVMAWALQQKWESGTAVADIMTFDRGWVGIIGNATIGGTLGVTGIITANTATNALLTNAESWIGPSSTTGIYFKGGFVGIGTTTIPSMLTVNGLINLKNYTVATLPAGTRGDVAYVTDALAPTFLATIVGNGAVVAPVFYNGANWIGF